MDGEQKKDDNQCCKMLREKLKKEIDLLKRVIMKKGVSEIKNEKIFEELKQNLEEKEKIIKELQLKYDEMIDVQKNSTQEELELSTNEQLDSEEHKVKVVTATYCVLR